MSTLFQPSTYSTAVVFLRSYFRPRDQLARLRSRVFQSWRVSSDCRCCKFPAEHKEVSCYAVLFFNREHVWLDQRAATWGSQHPARKKVCLHSRLSLSLAAKPLSVFVKWKPLRQISLTFVCKDDLDILKAKKHLLYLMDPRDSSTRCVLASIYGYLIFFKLVEASSL